MAGLRLPSNHTSESTIQTEYGYFWWLKGFKFGNEDVFRLLHVRQWREQSCRFFRNSAWWLCSRAPTTVLPACTSKPPFADRLHLAHWRNDGAPGLIQSHHKTNRRADGLAPGPWGSSRKQNLVRSTTRASRCALRLVLAAARLRRQTGLRR